MLSVDLSPTKKRTVNPFSADFLDHLPSLITSLRLVILPHLAYSLNQGFIPIACVLFLIALGSDLADGYAARKLGVTSKFGAYFDATVDFVLIFGLFGVFINLGWYSNWILLLVLVMYLQFVITSLLSKRTVYDPIGKYYGSLLFAGIGLTLLFPNQLTYTIVNHGIVISTVISIISRLYYLINPKKRLAIEGGFKENKPQRK